MAVGGFRLSKLERQGAILRLVRERGLSTQDEVADSLRTEGYDAVQTTVSRDIAQLGLVKVRNTEGRLVYAQPTDNDIARRDDLAAALRRWALQLLFVLNVRSAAEKSFLRDTRPCATIAGVTRDGAKPRRSASAIFPFCVVRGAP